MIMETIKNTSYEAVNNVEYSNESARKVNTYAEKYQQLTLDILENPNTQFSEFIKEQSLATDIARLWGLKQWALLKEQLSALGLYDKQKPVNNESFVWKEQKEQGSVFWAPNMTVQLWGLVA